MNTAMEIKATEVAAKAGFGRRRMMQLAEEVAKRPLKHLGELTESEGEKFMLLCAVLATPDSELETLREIREKAEEKMPANKRKRMQVEYRSAGADGRRIGQTVREQRMKSRTA